MRVNPFWPHPFSFQGPITAQQQTPRAARPNVSLLSVLKVRYCNENHCISFPWLDCSVNYSLIPSHCCFPSGSRQGTTAGILLVLFFVLIFVLVCVVYKKTEKRLCCKNRRPEQMSWERKSNNNSHLPQGIVRPLQPWLEYLCYWESCSSLAAFILWQLKAHFLSPEPTIEEDILLHKETEWGIHNIHFCMALLWRCFLSET